MAYASRSGRARTSSSAPRAFAVCQRCGIWYNRVNLHFQYDWRGAQLQNLYILVCDECLDVPQEQLRAIILPPDPVPVFYPSTEDFQGDETDYRAVSVYPPVTDPVTGIPIPSTTLRVTQDCRNRVLQPTGDPRGLIQDAIMPYDGAVQEAFGVVLPVLSAISAGNPLLDSNGQVLTDSNGNPITDDSGSFTITVTCSAVHNLQPGNQISASGLTGGNGFFTVAVPTATQFTYQVVTPVPQGSLLQSGSRIVTANAGLPRGYTSLPL